MPQESNSTSRVDRALPRRWPELPVVLAFIALAGALWAFGWIANEVVQGGGHGVDLRIMLLLRNPDDRMDPIGPRWFEEMARDLTALGSVGVLVLITALVAGFLLLARRRAAALLVTLCLGGGWLLTMALKRGFDRPRPDLLPHGTTVFTASFPSGHAAMSAIVYLTLGAMLARLQPTRALRVYIMSAAVSLTLLIGTSRVYLAVHWPSDVVAGWTIGAAWALACWLVMRTLQRRGQVETVASEDKR